MLTKMSFSGAFETPDVLWTNSNPATTFTGGTVVDATTASKYKWIVLEYTYSTNNRTPRRYIMMPIYDGTGTLYYNNGMTFGISGGNTSIAGYLRGIFANQSGIAISGATAYGGAAAAANTEMIPLTVYGYKCDFPFTVASI